MRTVTITWKFESKVGQITTSDTFMFNWKHEIKNFIFWMEKNGCQIVSIKNNK